jgi:DNA (cytosine-5)-methyltransferase 1
VKKNKFTFIDFFSGVGGFRIPAEKFGGKCIGFSEIDQSAISVYEDNFNNDNESPLGDITNLHKLPKADVYFGGVPCQAWSVAGKKLGFEDPRGKLWEDTIRVTAINKPKVFIYENVKGLLDPRNRPSLNLILSEFNKAGYKTYYSLLNAYDFGLPQNRDRIFIVGIRKDIATKPFMFPKPFEHGNNLSTIIDELPSKRNKKKSFQPKDLFGEQIPASRNRFQKNDELNDFFIFCDTRDGHTTIHSWDLKLSSRRDREICMTILKNRRKSIYGPWDGNPMSLDDLSKLVPNLKLDELKRLVKKDFLKIEDIDGKEKFELRNTKNSAGIFGVYRVFMPSSKIFSTITATENRDFIALEQVNGVEPDQYKKDFINKIYKPQKFRLLTGRETARLQGFPDKFKIHSNDKTAKKHFGNAVPAKVVESVLGELINQKFI